ncbi:olfactory receptor 5AP2-like [Candoia aspera]|uniref:olfactory receptor 5AP2-like n=1 Tax=Candoia aspera TaxID=51853 RepID=UPI002FD7FE56
MTGPFSPSARVGKGRGCELLVGASPLSLCQAPLLYGRQTCVLRAVLSLTANFTVLNLEFPRTSSNQTHQIIFVFLGFSTIQDAWMYLFLVYLVIYMATIMGNVLIFTLIQLDASLHSPMYFFLSHLSCLDICLSSVTVPKILLNLFQQQHTISYHGCMAQMFFLLSFTGTEAALLALMAYDRFAAICKPLHYSSLMSGKSCVRLVVVTWLWGFFDSILHTAMNSNLHFCGIHQIPHIYCDVPPLIKIACGDIRVNKISLHIASIYMGLGPFLITVLSYYYILNSVFRIRSNTGRCKAFSTCASHMLVVILYFGNGLVNYNRPRSGYSLEVNTLVSTMYCIVPPMLNPLIYSLRNKEVKGALWKVLENQHKLYTSSHQQPWHT